MSAAQFPSHLSPGHQCPLRNYNQHTSCLREAAASCAGHLRRSATSGNRLPHTESLRETATTSGAPRAHHNRRASGNHLPQASGHQAWDHWRTATSGCAFPPSAMCPTALQAISESSSMSQPQRGLLFFLSHLQSRTWCVLCRRGQTQGAPASPQLQGHHQASPRLAPQATSLQLF